MRTTWEWALAIVGLFIALMVVLALLGLDSVALVGNVWHLLNGEPGGSIVWDPPTELH